MRKDKRKMLGWSPTLRYQREEARHQKHLFSLNFILKGWQVMIYLLIYLFIFGCPGCSKWGLLFTEVGGFLSAAASLADHRLQSLDSVIVVHGLSLSAECGIFPDQGSNPCIGRWILNHCNMSPSGS